MKSHDNYYIRKHIIIYCMIWDVISHVIISETILILFISKYVLLAVEFMTENSFIYINRCMMDTYSNIILIHNIK